MKYLIRAAIACAALVASGAYAQTYNYFKPGCALSGTGSSQTVNLGTGSGCVAGNLPPTNLNSGSSASSTTFWRGDGTWATPSGTGGGTVNSVALSAPSVFSVAGSPVTNTGTLALTFASGQTANEFLATPSGSTGAVALRALAIADLFGGTGASSSTFLRGDGTWVAPSGVSAANPSASAGLTAVNGSAATYMRSDAAPAISTAISPTMSGNWIFSPSSGQSLQVATSATNFGLTASGPSGTQLVALNMQQSGQDSWALYQPASSDHFAILNGTTGGTPFDISGLGNVSVEAPTSGWALVANSVASPLFSGGALLLNAPNTASNSNGMRIIAGTNASDSQLVMTNAANSSNYWIFDGTGSLASNGQTQQGAGTINVAGLYVNGTAVGAGSSPANPATSVGLTVSNGTATTFMRSDAAPALAQNISPTWTGTHTFSNGVTAASFVAKGTSGNTYQATPVSGTTQSMMQFYTDNNLYVDAPSTGTPTGGLIYLRAGSSSTTVETISAAGITVGSPSGGAKGAGSINAQAVYANGVSLSGVTGLVIAKGEIVYGSGSACTVTTPYNIASCTRLGTGEYEVIFTSSVFSTVPVCTATAPSGNNPGGNSASVTARFVSTPSTSDVVIGTNSTVSPFTSVDQTTNLICVGS